MACWKIPYSQVIFPLKAPVIVDFPACYLSWHRRVAIWTIINEFALKRVCKIRHIHPDLSHGAFGSDFAFLSCVGLLHIDYILYISMTYPWFLGVCINTSKRCQLQLMEHDGTCIVTLFLKLRLPLTHLLLALIVTNCDIIIILFHQTLYVSFKFGYFNMI